LKKTDQHIIKACQKGDRKAQNQLYEKYKVLLFNICMRYASSREEAEDFLQEGLIVIFKDLYQYQPKGALGAWLRKVMVNVCLQKLRKQKKGQLLALDEIAEVPDKDDDFFEHFRVKALLQMVQNLPTSYRVIFNLYVMEGYKHSEIAEKLNIPVNTSKTRLARAKAMLRNRLEEELANKI